MKHTFRRTRYERYGEYPPKNDDAQSKTPSVGSSDSGDGSHGQNARTLSSVLDSQKQRGVGAAMITVTVQRGRNLAVMDPNGKSDPYCIVTVGDLEERTSVRYSTIDPEWGETLSFEVTGVPQLMQTEPAENVASCCLVHYMYIDVWDHDVLNRDDFMGRVVIPIATLTEDTLSTWFLLGRGQSKGSISGEIFLEISLKATQPIPRWCVDNELQSLCKKRTDFELMIKSGNNTVGFPGEEEHVEIVIDDVIIEVSKHRGIGRMYLTNFRLVFLCNISRSITAGHVCDMSMWVALNNIQSVDRGEDEKAVRRTADGNARFSDVKTLTIHCWDFRTIHLIFVDTPQSVHNYLVPPEHRHDQPSANSRATEITKQTGGTPDSASPPGTTHHDVLHVVETDDRTHSSSRSSFQVLSHSSSSSSVEGASSHGSESLVIIPQGTGGVLGAGVLAASFGGGVFMSDAAYRLKTGVACTASFLRLYIGVFYQRLENLALNVVDNPPSSSFIRTKGEQVELSGWTVYSFNKEFTRQQVSDSWRVTGVNQDFAVCSSYPRLLHIPAAIEDSTLEECASFRSKGRMPALCWFNAKKGNFIMRCAQPKSGPGIKSSLSDENVLLAARKCNTSTDKLVIFDARSMFAAGGNMLKGKGTEDVINRYQGCQLLFLDIPNIHAVRDSLSRLQTVCESSAQKKWLSHLESTQWLAYISAILKGAATIARFVNKGVAALVHCSDGWDRTSQLTSLAQLLMDPYYRTHTGFQVLVEKEWVSFGHRFRDRLGHPSCPSQRSPVFLQFLDCVWQVQQQFPDAFEFSAAHLLRIADHTNSQWFGNFLCNNIKERNTLSISGKTVSLWAHLDAMRETFLNPTYKPHSEVIFPASSPRRLFLWTEYFLRFDESAWSAQESEDNERDTESIFSKPLDTVVWVPDDRAKECRDCRQRFTNFRRKHHCRACGHVFCGDCTKQRAHLPQFGYTNPERVCDTCYQQNKIRQSVDEEEDEFEVITFPHLPT